MEQKIPLLTTDDIEVKIKQCTKNGAVALLYKTARVDYRILDQVYGPLGWQVDYNEIKGNLYCTISLWDKENKQWVRKTNCGIESREDGDGNEKKGEASDAAKRAGFVVGIGAELYNAPFILLNVNTTQGNDGKWHLTEPYAKYVVTEVTFNEETRVMTSVTIANEKTGVVVFEWKLPATGPKAKKMSKTTTSPKKTPESTKPVAGTNTSLVTEQPAEQPKMPLKDLIKNIGLIAKRMAQGSGDLTAYTKIITEVTGDSSFKCSKATEAQYDTVLKIYKALVAGGFDK